ncbi:transposase [Aminicella lysinilytica]|jgi:transposase|uniref:Transposase n=1 Tax=Aminicella lysinilytica TaxID=433323 RepID=A0A4R6Q058_9FIRM|nr:transposase [Aminicella lysinilytica]TDP43715.1 transposase [Aminicella lysinilytica]
MPRRYSSEFKKDALQYVRDHPDIDMRVCAEYLGMPYDTLYGWYKMDRREQSGCDTIDAGASKLSDEEKENIRLRRELRDTKDALEVLKKAISILGK